MGELFAKEKKVVKKTPVPAAAPVAAPVAEESETGNKVTYAKNNRVFLVSSITLQCCNCCS